MSPQGKKSTRVTKKVVATRAQAVAKKASAIGAIKKKPAVVVAVKKKAKPGTLFPKNPSVKPRPRKPKGSVAIVMPRVEMMVGSYHRIPLKIAGMRVEDLAFEVPDGAKAGLVSPSLDETVTERRPQVMLCVGYAPGTYKLVARHVPTGQVVAEAEFTSTSLWSNPEESPSKWFTGITQGFSAGSAWGGGPGTPQNVGTINASGTRRVAILLVDTASQRYSTDAPTVQGFRDQWMNALVNGVADAAGVVHSADLLFREMSYGAFGISAQVFGPVSLSGNFGDYFEDDGIPKGEFFQACFTAGDDLINYNDFDTLLCVTQHVNGPPVRSAWPYASIGEWGPYTTAEGNHNFGVISMPNAWETLDGRRLYETFAHELGHNLGMGDQYNPTVPGRNPGAWELMHADGDFPHVSLAHRMMLGWVDPSWVEGFNFQSMATPTDRTITLSPVAAGAPPAGRKVGIEVRIADGWNYYLEYRAAQTGQVGDQALPVNSRVLGTDVVSSPYSPPIARPGILLLNNDIDGDGAVLGNGTDYEETDTSDPVYPTDFRIDVSGIDGTKADVRVRYGVNSRPDPSIRPWPASPERQWQSPDIEVRNARNDVDPAWFNTPWVGNDNRVVAKVKNNGALDAPGVRVNFYVKNYNVGSNPETYIGFDTKDVAAGAMVEFQTNWVPPSEGHYCVVVRIPLYQHPVTPAVVEMTELNNVAQSNYDRFISTTSIPSRERSSIEVSNPYPIRTRVWICAGHSNPMYRSYLQHSWLYLDPGESRSIEVMYEYAPDHLSLDLYPKKALSAYRKMLKEPNRVAFTSYIENPKDNPRHNVDVYGGAQAVIVTGRSTKMLRFQAGKGKAAGYVVFKEGGEKVKKGQVLLRMVIGSGDSAKMTYKRAALKGGQFVESLDAGTRLVKAYFLPAAGDGPCESEEIRVH